MIFSKKKICVPPIWRKNLKNVTQGRMIVLARIRKIKWSWKNFCDNHSVIGTRAVSEVANMAAGAKDRWADTQINAKEKLLRKKIVKKDNVFLFQISTEKGAGGRERSVYKMTWNDKYRYCTYVKQALEGVSLQLKIWFAINHLPIFPPLWILGWSLHCLWIKSLLQTINM